MFQALVCFCFSNTQLKHSYFIDSSAMPKVHASTMEFPAEPQQDTIMNSKLLFAATVAVALIGSVALAGAGAPIQASKNPDTESTYRAVAGGVPWSGSIVYGADSSSLQGS
jgi:hypothetical protein